MKKFKEYGIVSCILLIIISLIYYKFLDGSLLLASGDSFSAQAVKHSIKGMNSFPNWYPYLFSGVPTIHSLISAQHLYPPHHIISFLHDIFGLPWIWNFILHYIFGGLGTYKLLRFFNQNKYASIFGASLFVILPSMIAYLAHGHGSQVMTACYIPWVMVYLFKVYEKNKLIDVSIFSIFLGLQLLRGHTQIAYYTWMMIGLYMLIKFIQLIFRYKTIKLVKAMGSEGFIWRAGGVRAHTANPEMLKLWKENGCTNVTYGIESGSPTMLQVMEKAFDEVTMREEDWTELIESIEQQAGGEQQGQGQQQGQDVAGASPEQLQEMLAQLPPEVKQQVQSAIQSGVSPQKALQGAMQQASNGGQPAAQPQ